MLFRLYLEITINTNSIKWVLRIPHQSNPILWNHYVTINNILLSQTFYTPRITCSYIKRILHTHFPFLANQLIHPPHSSSTYKLLFQNYILSSMLQRIILVISTIHKVLSVQLHRNIPISTEYISRLVLPYVV